MRLPRQAESPEVVENSVDKREGERERERVRKRECQKGKVGQRKWVIVKKKGWLWNIDENGINDSLKMFFTRRNNKRYADTEEKNLK